jgi:hypothetical protein
MNVKEKSGFNRPLLSFVGWNRLSPCGIGITVPVSFLVAVGSLFIACNATVNTGDSRGCIRPETQEDIGYYFILGMWSLLVFLVGFFYLFCGFESRLMEV